MYRRDILKLGVISPFFTLNCEASTQKNKNVIVLFLGGGMSHSDNFNIAPDAVDKYKSVSGFIPIKQGYIGGNWEKLAKVGNLFSLVHSFGHINSGHQGGSTYVISGYNFTDENQGAKPTYPSPGSLISKQYGTTSNGLPSYVSSFNNLALNSAYLGNIYNPFSLNDEGKKDLSLNIQQDRLGSRKVMLEQLNKFVHAPSYIDAHKEQAFKILSSDSRKVFEVEQEPNSIQELYGKTNIGKQLLLARRLIEKGTRIFTANDSGWDHHSNIKESLNKQVPDVDQAISGLLIDLSSRGLLSDTLVVVCTEFGRTALNGGSGGSGDSKIPGRDHYSRVTPLLLAGGNYGGTTIGTMDKNGFDITSPVFSPLDLLYTILNHVGIPGNTLNTDLSGRPRFIIENEAKLIV